MLHMMVIVRELTHLTIDTISVIAGWHKPNVSCCMIITDKFDVNLIEFVVASCSGVIVSR